MVDGHMFMGEGWVDIVARKYRRAKEKSLEFRASKVGIPVAAITL